MMTNRSNKTTRASAEDIAMLEAIANERSDSEHVEHARAQLVRHYLEETADSIAPQLDAGERVMIVKVQIPVATNEAHALALIYNKDRSFIEQVPAEQVRCRFHKGEHKAFFDAQLEGETLEIGERVSDKDW